MHPIYNQSSQQKYRPDIDGLRAFAVLSVVVFHAFPSLLKGGFIGVDVFFVISGYLISTIILESLERGAFTFPDFYARRVRRIYPALLVVAVASITFAWFALLGDELVSVSKHVMAGLAFASNFVLWSESGYFDRAAELKPLLHLWSLGVEEQFYIVWPFVVWALWKKPALLFVGLICIVLLSFGLNVYRIQIDPVGTFYSPLTRFWELSVGSLLAYLTWSRRFNPGSLPKWQSNLLSSCGAVLLVLGVLVTTKGQSFPGWWALPPVIGTTFLIAAGGQAWINRVVLSNKIAVWFGLISFPLYLWHWPLLSFGRLVESQTPSRSFRLFAIVIATVLAWATYRYLERHVRHSKSPRAVPVLLALSVCLACFAGYVYVNDGIPNRGAIRDIGFTEEVKAQIVGPSWAYSRNEWCQTQHPFIGSEKLSWWFCIKSKDAEPTILLLGNSYANQLYPGFIKNPLFSHHTVLSIGTCDFAGVGVAVRDVNNPCYGGGTDRQVAFITELIRRHKSIQFVILDGLERRPDSAYIERLRMRLDTLQALGIKVVVFGPHVTLGFNPKACFTTPLRARAKDCTVDASERDSLEREFQPLVEALARSHPDVPIFHQNDVFCDMNRCSFVKDGLPLFRDEIHTSEYASELLQGYFSQWARRMVPGLFVAQ